MTVNVYDTRSIGVRLTGTVEPDGRILVPNTIFYPLKQSYGGGHFRVIQPTVPQTPGATVTFVIVDNRFDTQERRNDHPPMAHVLTDDVAA